MKSILIITPSRAGGGTNSALSSIYTVLRKQYDVCVVVMASNGDGEYDFLKKAECPYLLDLYYRKFSDIKGRSLKIQALILKGIGRLFTLFNKDLESKLLRFVACRMERERKFDYVVGFQESRAMHFAAQFANPCKMTWVHCDYERAFPEINEKELYRKFKKIICVSNFTRRKFVVKYPELAEKTVCIYNLLDEERIKTMSLSEIDDCRFVASTFTILSVGRMDVVKRFHLIPQIAKKIKDKGVDFRWYILGGPLNDEYHKIIKLISEYEVDEYVIMLGPKTNPYPYFRQSDLLVSTSSSEACPMVFNEAKILGLPIVSADFGSALEFIDNGYNGFVQSVDNLDGIIAELASLEDRYQSIKGNCKSNIKANINIKKQLFTLFSE